MMTYIQWKMLNQPVHSLYEIMKNRIYDGTFEPEPPIYAATGSVYSMNQYSADNVYVLKLEPDTDPFDFAQKQSKVYPNVVISVHTNEHQKSYLNTIEIAYLPIDFNLVCEC